LRVGDARATSRPVRSSLGDEDAPEAAILVSDRRSVTTGWLRGPRSAVTTHDEQAESGPSVPDRHLTTI
jgi:hypothetical protein